jgi:hypothetical protein
MRRAAETARAVKLPLEEVLTATLAATLPDLDDAPSEMRMELARMTWLSDQELWSIANSVMPLAQQEQLQALASTQAQRALDPEEMHALEQLRHEYARVTLRKARAFALLSLRGGSPLLADLHP